MDTGIHFMNFTLPGGPSALGPTLAATAKAADEGGARWFTLMDHYFQMESIGRSEDPMLEGYTALGFVAGITSQVELGLVVTGVTYRHPGLLVKIATTLDVLSGGRAFLGLGAAWYEREHLGLGVPFPPMAERFELLAEALEIAHQMWSPEDGPYSGKHFQLAETICVPPPIRTPHPPIVIGGSGEKKTLRLVAEQGDACNLFAPDVATVKHKLEVLKGHCDAVGRDYDSILKTTIGAAGFSPFDDPDGFLKAAEELAAIGIDLIHVAPTDPDPERTVTDYMANVVPRLKEIG